MKIEGVVSEVKSRPSKKVDQEGNPIEYRDVYVEGLRVNLESYLATPNVGQEVVILARTNWRGAEGSRFQTLDAYSCRAAA